jgi:hypothetical protein
MKTIFITSLISALMSLLAIFGLSAMTIVPRHGAESWRSQMMLVAGVFLVGWLCVAFWMRPRQRPALPPRWLRGLLVIVGIVYMLGILFFVLG